jgi:hypothetical protein
MVGKQRWNGVGSSNLVDEGAEVQQFVYMGLCQKHEPRGLGKHLNRGVVALARASPPALRLIQYHPKSSMCTGLHRLDKLESGNAIEII